MLKRIKLCWRGALAASVFVLIFISCISKKVDVVYEFSAAMVHRVYHISNNNSIKFDNKLDNKFDFATQWLRVHRARTDWKALLKPCESKVNWGPKNYSWWKQYRSSGKTSSVSLNNIQPSKNFSRVLIHTKTASGEPKKFGGDFWSVYFKGPSTVAATVFDHDNGTYEAVALLMESGKYTIHAFLEYSLCDGLKDPPSDWFKLGNAQGHFQRKRTLGVIEEYRQERLLAAENITFEVIQKEKEDSIMWSINCETTCHCLANGHGRWTNNSWHPFYHGNLNINSVDAKSRPSKKRMGHLWIYGDSLAFHFWTGILNSTLCKEVFQFCNLSYNWIYPYSQASLRKKDSLDFRPQIVIDLIKEVLCKNEMMGSKNVLVLNFGIHYARSVSFETFKKLVQGVIVMLHNHKQQHHNSARIIWKTTTAARKEKQESYLNQRRFLTEQRVRLFDAYAMSEMCKAGILVLDIHPLTASYYPGPYDGIHYQHEVFKSAETELEFYAKAGQNYKTTEVCVADH